MAGAQIPFTQVGDPLPHSLEGFSHGVRADRVTGGSLVAVSLAEHEEVAQLVFMRWDVTEGRGLPMLGAESGPVGKGAFLSSSGLDSGGKLREFERSVEISSEAISGGRVSSCQGSACG